MNALRKIARFAGATAAALALPLAAHACSVCSVLSSEKNRRAFFDTTIFLSLLPLGLLAWGLAWVARKGRESLRAEFTDRDEDLPAEGPVAPRAE